MWSTERTVWRYTQNLVWTARDYGGPPLTGGVSAARTRVSDPDAPWPQYRSAHLIHSHDTASDEEQQ